MSRPGNALIAGVAAVALVTISISTIPTLASWLDTEWVHAGRVGVVVCDDPTTSIASRGEGRMLGGGIIPSIDLDTLAEAEGALVTNDGSVSAPNEITNPLSVTALSSLNLDLTGLITLPLDNATGAVNQYASADRSGMSIGAAGLVADSGGVLLDPAAQGFPELGTINLRNLVAEVNPDAADGLTDVTNVTLDIGAVAARAKLDACAAAFSSLAGNLNRDYLVSSLVTTIDSLAVGALVDEVQVTTGELQSAVDGIVGNAGVLSAITNGVTGLLGALGGGLGLGTPTAQVEASIELTETIEIVTGDFSDGEGIVTVSPSAGSVQVDLAGLLEKAYPGELSDGLNGLPPNTEPFAEPGVLAALETALIGAINGWIDNVRNALASALDALSVTADVTVPLTLETCLLVICETVPIGSVVVSVTGGLGELLDGQAEATVDSSGLLALAQPVLGLITNLVLSPLINGLGGIVAEAVHDVLAPKAVLPTPSEQLSDVVASIGNVFDIFGDVVTITLNNQNGHPDSPAEWSELPDGRYDVSALRIGVFDPLGTLGAHVHVARGSVGPNCTMGPIDACVGY